MGLPPGGDEGLFVMRHVLGCAPQQACCSNAFQALQLHLCQEKGCALQLLAWTLPCAERAPGPLCAAMSMSKCMGRQEALPGPSPHPPIFLAAIFQYLSGICCSQLYFPASPKVLSHSAVSMETALLSGIGFGGRGCW